MEAIDKGLGSLDINQINDPSSPFFKDNYDVIKKPRTNFSNNALRRVIPNMNI